MNNPFPPPQQRIRLKPPRLLLLLGLVCAVQLLFAQYTWVGNTSNWYDVNNYSPTPGSIAALASQEVIIPSMLGSGKVWPSSASNTPITVKRLTLQAGAKATIPVGLEIRSTTGT